MQRIILPKNSTLSPREKARDMLSRISKEDAVKEITQLIYLSEAHPTFYKYWQDVLENVVNPQVKKSASSIW